MDQGNNSRRVNGFTLKTLLLSRNYAVFDVITRTYWRASPSNVTSKQFADSLYDINNRAASSRFATKTRLANFLRSRRASFPSCRDTGRKKTAPTGCPLDKKLACARSKTGISKVRKVDGNSSVFTVTPDGSLLVSTKHSVFDRCCYASHDSRWIFYEIFIRHINF